MHKSNKLQFRQSESSLQSWNANINPKKPDNKDEKKAFC